MQPGRLPVILIIINELAIYERRLLHKGLSRYTVYSDNSSVPGAVVQHNNAEFGPS